MRVVGVFSLSLSLSLPLSLFSPFSSHTLSPSLTLSLSIPLYQDFRRTLRAGGYMEATDLVSELEVKEANSQVAHNPYGEEGNELTGQGMSLTSPFISQVKEANS